MENINIFGIGGFAAIIIICLLAGMAIKATKLDSKWIPVICGALGGVLGALALASGIVAFPATDYMTAVAVGIVSGLASVGCHQVVKQLTGGAGVQNGQEDYIGKRVQRILAEETEAKKEAAAGQEADNGKV